MKIDEILLEFNKYKDVQHGDLYISEVNNCLEHMSFYIMEEDDYSKDKWLIIFLDSPNFITFNSKLRVAEYLESIEKYSKLIYAGNFSDIESYYNIKLS